MSSFCSQFTTRLLNLIAQIDYPAFLNKIYKSLFIKFHLLIKWQISSNEDVSFLSTSFKNLWWEPLMSSKPNDNIQTEAECMFSQLNDAYSYLYKKHRSNKNLVSGQLSCMYCRDTSQKSISDRVCFPHSWYQFLKWRYVGHSCKKPPSFPGEQQS